MKRLEIHTSETAPKPADDMLRGLETMLGFVPNVFAVMAGTPPVLSAFMAVNQKFAETSLTATEREIVQMTVSTENECAYCVAGHTAFAMTEGVPEGVIAALRNGGPIADPKLSALQAFTRAAVVSKGHIGGAELERFLAAGYTVEHVHEVVLGICVKTFSNLTSNMLGVPLDDAFAPHAWHPSDTQARTQAA